MKKILYYLLFLISICLITSCRGHDKTTEIYSFSASDDNIAINNGLIIIAPDTEEFIGGDVSFYTEQTGIKNFSTEFYYYNNGEKTTIQNNAYSIEGSEEGMSVAKQDAGSTSAESLFSEDQIEKIRQSLHFHISGTFIGGDIFEYDLALDVKKAY